MWWVWLRALCGFSWGRMLRHVPSMVGTCWHHGSFNSTQQTKFKYDCEYVDAIQHKQKKQLITVVTGHSCSPSMPKSPPLKSSPAWFYMAQSQGNMQMPTRWLMTSHDRDQSTKDLQTLQERKQIGWNSSPPHACLPQAAVSSGFSSNLINVFQRPSPTESNGRRQGCWGTPAGSAVDSKASVEHSLCQKLAANLFFPLLAVWGWRVLPGHVYRARGSWRATAPSWRGHWLPHGVQDGPCNLTGQLDDYSLLTALLGKYTAYNYCWLLLPIDSYQPPY